MSKPTALTARTGEDVALPLPETKGDKFRRLANNRASEIVNGLGRLGNLSGPAYEYSDTQVVALEKAIREATKTAFDKLRWRTARVPPRRHII